MYPIQKHSFVLKKFPPPLVLVCWFPGRLVLWSLVLVPWFLWSFGPGLRVLGSGLSRHFIKGDLDISLLLLVRHLLLLAWHLLLLAWHLLLLVLHPVKHL